MSKRRWLIVIVGLVVIAALALVLRFRDSATPVDESQVLVGFAGSVGSEPGDPGVYFYRTSGFEEIDALSGARHDYPDETFITIEDGPCGPIVTWRALAERWTRWEHCGPDLAITGTVEYHEWFGIPDEEVEGCDEPRPVAAAAASVACRAETSIETYRVEIVGTETVTVDGTEVETIHLRRVSTLSGDSSGETTADVWRLVGTPLIVRMEVASTSATASAIGDVHYTEQVLLSLLRLTPSG